MGATDRGSVPGGLGENFSEGGSEGRTVVSRFQTYWVPGVAGAEGIQYG
jgi:hypothetical protein